MRFVVPITLAVAFVASVLSADVPRGPVAPKKSAQVTDNMLRGLIGKGHFSDEACKLRKLIAQDPTATYIVSYDKSFYHTWKSEGLSLSYDDSSVVTCCFLYAEGHEGHGQYAGELPARLVFGDGPAAVRKKLGAPEEVIDSTTDVRWCYPSQGLSVQFGGADTTDPKAKLHMVIIEAVEEPK